MSMTWKFFNACRHTVLILDHGDVPARTTIEGEFLRFPTKQDAENAAKCWNHFTVHPDNADTPRANRWAYPGFIGWNGKVYLFQDV